MKTTNQTKWDTRDITKLIYRVAQDELDPGQLKKRGHVTIAYQKEGTGKLGHCYYGTPRNPLVYMRLNLPRNTPVDVVQLAKVIAHELGHAKGLKHREMNNTRYGWVDGWRERYAWAVEFPIRENVVPVVSKEDKLAKRREQAVVKATAKVQEWESTVKRSTTLLKKWRVKLRAAEKRVAPQPELAMSATS